MTRGVLIEKEEIQDLRFPNEDVLIDSMEIEKRQKDLDAAMQMGNNYKGKVQIIFDADDQTFTVETTVWASAGDHISLKGGINIPITAIREVVMF
jgi:hypothetical protein